MNLTLLFGKYPVSKYSSGDRPLVMVNSFGSIVIHDGCEFKDIILSEIMTSVGCPMDVRCYNTTHVVPCNYEYPRIPPINQYCGVGGRGIINQGGHTFIVSPTVQEFNKVVESLLT